MKPELSLSLQFADPRHRALLPRHKVQRFIRAALELPGEIAVRNVAAAEPPAVVPASFQEGRRATRGGRS